MRLRTRALTCSALVLAGLVCWLAYGAIGSHVDEQGILREPFGLIPIGWLLVFAGVAGLTLSVALPWLIGRMRSR